VTLAFWRKRAPAPALPPVPRSAALEVVQIQIEAVLRSALVQVEALHVELAAAIAELDRKDKPEAKP
jgi:hypothetical protein